MASSSIEPINNLKIPRTLDAQNKGGLRSSSAKPIRVESCEKESGNIEGLIKNLFKEEAARFVSTEYSAFPSRELLELKEQRSVISLLKMNQACAELMNGPKLKLEEFVEKARKPVQNFEEVISLQIKYRPKTEPESNNSETDILLDSWVRIFDCLEKFKTSTHRVKLKQSLSSQIVSQLKDTSLNSKLIEKALMLVERLIEKEKAKELGGSSKLDNIGKMKFVIANKLKSLLADKRA